jgi:hypothetical protein
MRRFQLLAALFFAVAFSAWLGRAERHTDDMGILVGLIGIGGFLLAMVEPRRPWMWGVLVPAGIIVVEIWNYAFGSRNPGTGGVGGLCAIAALTITVASLGSYVGAFIRRRITPA